MVGREQECQHRDDKKHDIGSLGVSKRNEMAYQRGGIDNEQTEQEMIVLWLQQHEKHDEESEVDEYLVDHLRAQFVLTTLAKKMDDSHESDKHHKACSDHNAYSLDAENRHLQERQRLKSSQCREMSKRCLVIELKEIIAGGKPIGCNKS